MTTIVRLDDRLVKEAQIFADFTKRSISKQVEHWAAIGRIVEDNADLSYQSIKDTLLGTGEPNTGRTSKYFRIEKSKN